MIFFVILSAAKNPSSRRPTGAQVVPGRFVLFNQRNLSFAQPAFDHRFSINRIVHVAKLFELNKSIDARSPGETVGLLLFVLPNPSFKRVRHSCVERAVLPVREDVNPRTSLKWRHGFPLLSC